LQKYITLTRDDARKREYDNNSVICSNLPYAARLGRESLQMDGFYRTFGDRIEGVSDSRAILLSGYEKAEELLGLGSPRQKWKLFNGSIPVMLYRWDLYSDR